MQDISNLGIRKQGIILCFNAYNSKFGRYPNNSQELTSVTSSRLSEDRFKKYRQWFIEFIGETESNE